MTPAVRGPQLPLLPLLSRWRQLDCRGFSAVLSYPAPGTWQRQCVDGTHWRYQTPPSVATERAA